MKKRTTIWEFLPKKKTAEEIEDAGARWKFLAAERLKELREGKKRIRRG